jgi:hypothetical protein
MVSVRTGRRMLSGFLLRHKSGWRIASDDLMAGRYCDQCCFFKYCEAGSGLPLFSRKAMKSKIHSGLTVAGLAALLSVGALTAHSADLVYEDPGIRLTDPTPVSAQKPAVDGINFKFSALTGSFGGNANHMFVASVTTPVPFLSSFGAQLDLGAGVWDEDFTSAAAALHIFHRDPDRGLIGAYADWGYINPEHAGRMGVEGALYMDRWSLDVFAGVQFGQHVNKEFVDEIDLSYYFTDNLRASIGHRLITRGHVANFSFEYMPDNSAGWSIFGEAEAGEDEYHSAWLGLRYSFGQSSANTLIERDRVADPIVRIPRNLASLTRCGTIQDPDNFHDGWNGFDTKPYDKLCSDKDTLDDLGAIEGKIGD